ncbi:MraY family glycosyltransferase [Pedobacter duraquae]|uniref:UDP-N-acetylmuramyl pentapeptide phosphotransferase/UDP-N-acetylglucosamine-1-phosphate transferase n=1 Tax=Pedobacter duraquae TaxID=425511 RepID=A0A4R6IJ06_9SPHI|nr:UDP-GlcNAc--UDP-phosphate GlcNAc-1-phosphate transferase [Pedobacter duraquae]TDO21982.1 UDP-N-acetylmuramyl pentapeptide phosphotransferase/UDP-N-acetylglucosamine-1-phosphate transferase [Pedobacter duraquae]
MIYFLIFCILLIGELTYFKVALQFKISDTPNNRSSHQIATIRGGGIVFVFAVILFAIFSKLVYPYFVAGLLMIGLISFMDDVFNLGSRIRLFFQFLAILLLLFQWGPQPFEAIWYLAILIIIVGVVNAYNFMDGINGLTGLYSSLLICTLYYINENIVHFISQQLLVIVFLSLVVFNIFNVRKFARCFAGDVGSISFALIAVFCIGSLILKTGNINYILFLLIYGLDSLTTILFRLLRGENIMEAHRSHFYQFLANEKGIPHVVVSLIYVFSQLAINVVVLLYVQNSNLSGFSLTIVSLFIFLCFRITLEKERLLRNKI